MPGAEKGGRPPLPEALGAVVDLEAVLETERLRLEPLRRAHAAEMFPILADPRLYRFVPREPPTTCAPLEERFQRLEAARAAPEGTELWLNWIARAKRDGQCIGRVEVTLREDRSAYLAYELGAASWGQGFATEACRRVIESLFGDYGVTHIVAEVDTRNAPSMRLLERLGFARGALRKDADFFKGATSDELTFTLDLRQEPKTGDFEVDATMRTLLWHQFGAAIDMLENAIDACPDDLWSDRSRNPQYWYVAYHTLFWLDLYSFGAVEGYVPGGPFNAAEELDPAGIIPARAFTKQEIKAYLEQGRKRTRKVIDSLTSDNAHARHSAHWGEIGTVELLLYNMRHVQHHTAQLNLLLRQTVDSAPGWVCRAKTDAGVMLTP